MAKTFSLAKYAETLERSAPAESVRDIEAVTGEVIHLKQELARNIVAIGLRLMEAKEMLPHGEWLPWLEGRVCFSEKTAQNYMRVAREFPNPQLVADLGVRKALALLELPPSEREDFAAENNVIDMTSRELEKAIRERDEAKLAAEKARAEAQNAEESRAKMEADMRALKEMHQSALDEAEQAAENLLDAQKELEMLRNRPVEVAVEVDREAVAEMEERVRQAEAARREAEAALEEARRQLERKDFQDDRKDGSTKTDWAILDRIVSQTRDSMNQLSGIKLKAHGKGEAKLEEAVRKALLYLSNYAKSCAE